MSVQTTADAHLEDAANHVQAAVAALSEIVVEQCSGHDEWEPQFRKDIFEAFHQLLLLRDTNDAICNYLNRSGRYVQAFGLHETEH